MRPSAGALPSRKAIPYCICGAAAAVQVQRLLAAACGLAAGVGGRSELMGPLVG